MQTIVINNKEALVIGQLPSEMKDSRGVPLRGEIMVFIPGVNLVDTAKLKALRANKLFDAHFSTKIPRSAAPEQNPEKVGHPILKVAKELNEKMSFKDIPAQDAIALIEETFTTAILDRWLADEGRNDVRAAIMSQKDFLATGKIKNAS